MNNPLPVIQSGTHQSHWRVRLVHTLRFLAVLAICFAIPRAAEAPRDGAASPTTDQLIAVGHAIDPRDSITDRDSASGLWVLKNPDGNPTGWVARTFPDAQDAIGYRGPTEASVLLSADLKIISVRLLISDDTEEHVEAVRQDRSFFEQFEGWDWTVSTDTQSIDGVTGATLTSLALAEGLARRMGGEVPSLVFSQPLSLSDVKPWFKEADVIDANTGEVFDSDGERIGRVQRSGVLSDDVIGYQGPSELLLNLDENEAIIGVRIRRSFDNEPYVDYVRTEYGFWKRFQGMRIQQLANFDPIAEGVEGVSGATMTSQAIAHTLVAAAQKYQRQLDRNEPAEQFALPRLSRWDRFTMLMVIMAISIQWFGVQKARRFRRAWLLAVVAIVGVGAGNLLSMSLIAGWSAEGIAWRLAPGLAIVAAVALLFPLVTKHNLYCNHLCPHGAIQQLVKPGRPNKRMKWIRSWVPSWLAVIPGVMLLVAYTCLLWSPGTDLSSWEPFHAYLFRICKWSAIVFAVITIVVSRFLPMAYCRYGCPTGYLLRYLKLSAKSGLIRKIDLIVLALLIVTWSLRFFS